MKKLIFALLIGSLLLLSLCACNQSNNNESTTPENTTESTTPDNATENTTSGDISDSNVPIDPSEELDVFFAKLQNDANEISKIFFIEEDKDLHYELKASGKYDDECWDAPRIEVQIGYDYRLVIDEDWYKACSEKDFETLNTAFWSQYSDALSEGHFFSLHFAPILHFVYEYTKETMFNTFDIFYADYAVLKTMVDLEYVNYINVTYQYSVPGSYFDE